MAEAREFFADKPPTRTTLVTDVRDGALVEVSTIAVPVGADREVLHPAGWMKSPRPYSYIVRAGGLVFLSGLVSRRGVDDKPVPGPVNVQVKTILDNAGTDVLMQACKDPNKIPDLETLNKALRKPLLEVFPPALLGRMVTIPYYPLSDDMIRRIVRLQLERIVKRVQARHGIPLVYDESVPALIASRCTELESGARMIEALLSNTVLPRLSHEFLTRLVQGAPLTQIEITTKDGDFAYNMS